MPATWLDTQEAAVAGVLRDEICVGNSSYARPGITVFLYYSCATPVSAGTADTTGRVK